MATVRHPYTFVYARGVGDSYRFDDASYEALGNAGINWRSVLWVLRSSPRVRRHIGAVLQVAGLADDGRWIAVALIEEESDDQYLVVSARVLSDPEVRAVQAMIEGNV
jgi:hypothetical protein